METSAVEFHQGTLDLNPEPGDHKRLFIDLDICSGECKECVVECSYFYHPFNNGIRSVIELATFALVCRRCENPHCVNSCPVDALEQQKDKNNMLIRHNMRCISCKTCSHACPYGTIYPENVPYLINICDYCLDRRENSNANDIKDPICIKTCPYGALSLKKPEKELPENTFLVGKNLIVHSTHWRREKA